MRILSLGIVILLFAPFLAYAQTDEEIFEEFQFNFATPGARANAMGRALPKWANGAGSRVRRYPLFFHGICGGAMRTWRGNAPLYPTEACHGEEAVQ